MSRRKLITIGEAEGRRAFKLDVDRLIVTRALVTASSGGGKSWLLRKILEVVSAETQTIVIDPEGEFASLRELRDMVLVAPDGDIPPAPRSAGLLCRRLMEKNVSAVIDIYELTPTLRREFVNEFLTTMVNLPKSLWRPCFIAIDEVHEFAPNNKDKDYVSSDAVALLFSKGRKRGFCPIIATQRLQKLSTDVAAEAKNRFIGQMTLDLDQKRAADFLGWGKDRWPDIRDLSPPGHEGEFFAIGPALVDRGIIRFRAGAVKTTHPRAGDGALPEPPAPSKKIRGVLDEFKDLPQQAEAEIKDFAAAKLRIAELERQLKSTPSNQGKQAAPSPSPAIVKHLRAGLEEAMSVIKKLASHAAAAVEVDREQINKVIANATDQIVKIAEQHHQKRNRDFEALKVEARRSLERITKLIDSNDSSASAPAQAVAPPAASAEVMVAADPVGREELNDYERSVLDAAATFPAGATRQKIGVFAGKSVNSSSFSACFSSKEPKEGARPSLVIRGLLRLAEGSKDRYIVTDAGRSLAQPTKGSSVAEWLAKLDQSESKVLKAIADAYPDRLTRDQVSELTGQSRTSSSFTGAFVTLRDLHLIEGTSDFRLVEGLAR